MIAIIIIPFVLAIITLFMKQDSQRYARRNLLIAGALSHNIGSLSLLFYKRLLSWKFYIYVDDVGLIFLLLMSFIFTIVSFYSLGYFPLKRDNDKQEAGGHIYVSCMLFFLTTMTLAISTLHLGVLWIAIEGTTLASAPLIYYRQNKRSLEAAWKYLLICSVGIALALLGVFFVAASTYGVGIDLFLPDLINHAKELNSGMLRLGFIFILVGFGTKMGLAPLHNWLPDAHSEAPSPISALLSATLLNCALLGIIRFYQICLSAGQDIFAKRLLIVFGIISLFVATVFIAFQRDYKRLLAYSSIEHMGIIALGIGVGANFASLLHVIGHSLTKTLLFLTAGNILILYKSKNISDISGLLRTSYPTGILFMIGGLAIVGAPPFLPFLSEYLILRGGIDNGHSIAMIFYLLFLSIIFIWFSKVIFKIVQGEKKNNIADILPNITIVPSIVLAVSIFMMGLYLPKSVSFLIESAVQSLGKI